MTSNPETSSSGGWLALVATPIGNLEDITLLAVRVLREADLIAAEDTRRAGILCKAHNISAPLVAYHAWNEHHRTTALLAQVTQGKKVAVLSDAGTPAISDPGFFLVRAAVQQGIEPQVIPGVSALTFAVVAAGLPVDQFIFAGFLPVKPGKRRAMLERVRAAACTCFFFESPHRITRFLEDVVAVLGPATPVALTREATKLHEETLRGTAGELLEKHRDRAWRGEFTIGISAKPVKADDIRGGNPD